ncbi:MAG: flagella synthesis protein FlgN [Candidatus Endobugula sp.]|jgi:flagella synthesis protein FlgN
MSDYNLETIQSMVQKDHAISQQLLTLLQNETASIQERNYDSVKAILFDKAPLLDQLKRHAEIRKQWLTSLYKVADENNWKDFLASFNTPSIDAQWQEVNKAIDECKTINDTNGLLITRGKKTYSQLLHLLKGNGQQQELYTAKGNKQSTHSHYTVAKA